MIFNRIIANPPFGSLHLPILQASVENFVNLKEGGIIVSLQPIYFLKNPYGDCLNGQSLKMSKILKGKIQDIIEIDQSIANKEFNITTGNDLGIIWLKEGGSYQINFNGDETFKSIFLKVKSKKLGNLRPRDFFNKNQFCVKFRQGIVKELSKFFDEISKAKRFHNFNSEKEAENFKIWVCSPLVQCFFNELPTGDIAERLPKMKTFNFEWTDEKVIEFFNFSKKEWNFVKQSKIRKYPWSISLKSV